MDSQVSVSLASGSGALFAPLTRFFGLSPRYVSSFGLLLIGPLAALAQLTSGDLRGTVHDASGAAIPNAAIEVVNNATDVHTTQPANADGEYHFSNLPVGAYSLSAKAAGFAPAELKNITIDLNKIATANLTLQVGQTTTSIEVTESAATIDTSTAQISNTYSTKMTQDLPSATTGSGVLNLSLLGAGVASSGGMGAGTGPSVAGQRPRNNNFTIEGIDNNAKTVTGPLLFVPNDAVQEFTLLQNQFTAEYGHSSGGQFNTNVKSGTNEFHGMLYDYLQNRNLNAIDQIFQNQGVTSNPRFDLNRLGANFGGPIKKNKLFFFVDFEYDPLGLSSTTGNVSAPTAEGYADLAAIPGINSTLLGVVQKYVPAAASQNDTENFQIGENGTGCGNPSKTCYSIPIGTLAILGPNYTNTYAGTSSVDYNISDKDQLRGRFLYNKVDAIDAAAELPAFYLPLPTRFYLATLTEFHNFTPNVTNEFRLGYNRFNTIVPSGNFQFPGLDQFPNLQLDDLGIQMGPDTAAPQFTIQNLYQASDNITWTWNKHTFKFGFDGRKQISPQSFTQRARGDYEYSNIGNYLTDLVPDDLAQRTTGNYVYYGDQVSAYAYAEDTWKATQHLTLNLGVRYEFTSLPYGERLQDVNSLASVPGLIEFNRPQAQYLNFAPRLGVAWSPGNSGNTSVRAGFGINYDVLYDNLGILSAPPQFQQTVDVTGTAGSGFLANGGIPPNASFGALDVDDARANTGGYIPDQKLPYSIQWNFGIQHVFANNYTVEARYVGTRGVHLPVQAQIDRAPIVTASNSMPLYFSAPSQATLDGLPVTLEGLENTYNNTGAITAPFLNNGFFSPITAFMPWGNSTYHGLALQVDRRFSRGLTFRGAYTWSHAIDDSTADVFSTVLTPRRAEDSTNLALDKSSSALDRRQRFTLTMVYDVPFYAHSSNYILKNIVGNWEVAPIFTYQTPEYYTVQSGSDANLNGDTAGDRAVINASGTPGTSSDVTSLSNSAGQTVAYLVNNPNAQYIKAPIGVLPNGGRNTLEGRPIDNLDLTLLKRFNFTERFKFEFQAQFLNSLNHPQFIPGALNDIASIGSASAAVRNILLTGSSSFNQQESVFSSNPRTIQLTAKFVF